MNYELEINKFSDFYVDNLKMMRETIDTNTSARGLDKNKMFRRACCVSYSTKIVKEWSKGYDRSEYEMICV